MVHLVANDDWRPARNYVTLAASPRADGMLPMTVTGEIEHRGGYTIPDWALHWIHGVWNLFRHDGDRAATLSLLPVVERILRNAASAAWARAHWERGRDGFEDFWDPARGSYVDHIVAGERMPAMPQAAGGAAIVSGPAPEERWPGIVDTITDPARVVVRSWIGGDGGYDRTLLHRWCSRVVHWKSLIPTARGCHCLRHRPTLSCCVVVAGWAPTAVRCAAGRRGTGRPFLPGCPQYPAGAKTPGQGARVKQGEDPTAVPGWICKGGASTV